MIGIDEVGRGCWAGPLLVVAACKTSALPVGLDDSKKLSKNKREQLAEQLVNSCDFGEGWVTAKEIDQVGLTKAMQLGVERALESLQAAADEDIIMDGLINYCDPKFSSVLCVAKADSLHPIVSAASIWAKVARDAYMSKAAEEYPEYGFESHVGYGTAAHTAALKKFGITPLHRMSYKPVRKIYDAR